QQTKLVGQRQGVVNTESAANGSLPALEWIPGETKTQREVPQGRIFKIRRSQSRLGACEIDQVRQPVIFLGRDRRGLVPESQIQRQIRSCSVVILNVGAENCLAQINGC